MSGVGYARRMRPVIPVLWDVAVSKQVRHHNESNSASLRVPSASVVVSVMKTRNPKIKKIQHKKTETGNHELKTHAVA